MSPGMVMERSYKLLKTAIASGELRPGDRLDPAKLARQYDVSPTPVRDALYRLAGARLVNSRTQDGFEVPLPSETELRWQYSLSQDLLKLAIKNPKKNMGFRLEWSISHDDDPAKAVLNLFDAIARSAANPELTATIMNICERLQPVRRMEYMVFADHDVELSLLMECAAKGEPQETINLLSRYHKRRIRHVSDLITCLRCT